MARIETYPNDSAITINDKLLGTDGDSLNATKNYSVLKFLNYIGGKYNLQSVDLIYTYNAVASDSVGDGQLSTNNYADPTILASGVTSIYPSKLTAFGMLVEEYIETVGAANLSIMLVDLANYNNFLIAQINTVSDVDANTLQLDVSSSVSNGIFSSGRSVGIKVYAQGTGGGGGGAVDSVFGRTGAVVAQSGDYAAHYARLFGANILNGVNTFEQRVELEQGMTLEVAPSITTKVGAGTITLVNNDQFIFKRAQDNNYANIDLGNLTANRIYNVPDKNGTFAMLDDIIDPSGVYLPLSGGTMSGDVNMGQNRIDNIEHLGIANPSYTSKGGFLGMFSSTLFGLSPYDPNNIIGRPKLNYSFTNNQWQIDSSAIVIASDLSDYVDISSDQTVGGNKTFSGILSTTGVGIDLNGGVITEVGLDPYGSGWNGSTQVPSKKDIYDKIESLPPYQTGIFTPTLTDSTGGATYSLSSATAEYVKIGKMVHVEMSVTCNGSTGTPSGNLFMGNLPFNMAESYSLLNVEVSGAALNITNHYSIHAARATGQTTKVWFKIQQSLDTQNDTIVTSPTHTGGNTTIKVSGTYITDD